LPKKNGSTMQNGPICRWRRNLFNGLNFSYRTTLSLKHSLTQHWPERPAISMNTGKYINKTIRYHCAEKFTQNTSIHSSPFFLNSSWIFGAFQFIWVTFLLISVGKRSAILCAKYG
jgi:hypothetical protein